MPHIFRDKLELDSLTAQAAWQRTGEQYELKLHNISFANRDLAGTVQASYQTAAHGRGTIDLTGSATRADVRGVSHYIPLAIGERGRQWLDNAFVAGSSNDVKVRLKGNLNDFPFDEGKGGLFEVVARVTGGTLDYASAWPKIENIEGDLVFHGRRMDVHVRDGSIAGTRIANVPAELPDLSASERLLTVVGEADGATSEFLNFVAHTPVFDSIDRFSENLRADGRGKLTLKLTLPLNNLKDTKIAGTYQFTNNKIETEELPFAVEQLNARMEFTDTSVRVPAATMMIFGSPATLSGGTQRDNSVRINVAGRVNMENVQRSAANVPFGQSLRGSTDWKTTITLRKRVADILFESTLQGIASDLPPPFGKAAADALPLKLERIVTGAQQDQINVALGSIVSAQLQRRRENGQLAVDRGTVTLGGGVAAEPERKGVYITGGLKSFNFDHWLAISKAALGDTGQGQLAGIDVKFGTLDVFGRRFNDLAISGSAQAGVWQMTLVGRELVGEMTWRSQGKGKVTARMKNLVIPSASPERPPPSIDKEAPLSCLRSTFTPTTSKYARPALANLNSPQCWTVVIGASSDCISLIRMRHSTSMDCYRAGFLSRGRW